MTSCWRVFRPTPVPSPKWKAARSWSSPIRVRERNTCTDLRAWPGSNAAYPRHETDFCAKKTLVKKFTFGQFLARFRFRRCGIGFKPRIRVPACGVVIERNAISEGFFDLGTVDRRSLPGLGGRCARA